MPSIPHLGKARKSPCAQKSSLLCCVVLLVVVKQAVCLHCRHEPPRVGNRLDSVIGPTTAPASYPDSLLHDLVHERVGPHGAALQLLARRDQGRNHPIHLQADLPGDFADLPPQLGRYGFYNHFLLAGQVFTTYRIEQPIHCAKWNS